MTFLRKSLYWVAALLLAAFALPSSAQTTKLFTLSSAVYTNDATPVLSGVIPSGGSTAIVLLDFFNATPSGNSVINSVKVTVPGDVKYSFAQPSITKNNGSCPAPSHTTSSPTATGPFQLNNITGAKPGGHFCVYLAASTNSTTCTASTWTGYANTGNSFNGTLFIDPNTLDPSGASKTQTIDGCDGTLACGQSIGDMDPLLTGTPSTGIIRGTTNTDNTCTALIGYSLKLDVSDPTNQITTFVTVKNNQAFAVEYVLAWAPVDLIQVDDLDSSGNHTGTHTGLPNFVPRVAWLQDVPIAGQACLGTNISDPAIMPNLPAVVPSPYTGGTPAKMCIAGVEWVLQANGQIQYLVRVIDQTDSKVFGP